MDSINLETLQSTLQRSRQRLASYSETPGLDAQVLMAYAIGQERTWLLAHPEHRLAEEQRIAFEMGVNALVHGLPLPYVVGNWEFYGRSFIVTPDVLIPRPETELLIETALTWLEQHPGRRRAVDVGTGSGCIAITIAKYFANLDMTATDISPLALNTAERNVLRHQLKQQVRLIRTDLLSGLSGRFDLICANLPYIPTKMLHELDVFRREPTLALDGGADGLQLIKQLLTTTPKRLAAGGLALLEIEAGQAESAAQLAQRAHPQAAITIKPDLAGHPRLLIIAEADEDAY